MEKEYTFINFINDVLNEAGIPLSTAEIWNKGKEYGFTEKLGSVGKTPWDTIGARIYTDIKIEGENSNYIQISKHPSRFFFRKNNLNLEEIKKQIENTDEKTELKRNESSFNERDLHPLLVKFVDSNPHFRCYTKTIFHENSLRKEKGANEWLHPDLVGVYFPFNEYEKETLKLQKSMNINSTKIYSFEMKKYLDYGNLRQCYFQAVSNSSWANEGYLVALKVSEDSDFRNELNRLSNAFGIGLIELNVENINESEIICPARFNESLDWETVNRLVENSPDFKRFISDLTEDVALAKVKSKYDEVYDDVKFENYLKQKNINK